MMPGHELYERLHDAHVSGQAIQTPDDDAAALSGDDRLHQVGQAGPGAAARIVPLDAGAAAALPPVGAGHTRLLVKDELLAARQAEAGARLQDRLPLRLLGFVRAAFFSC